MVLEQRMDLAQEVSNRLKQRDKYEETLRWVLKVLEDLKALELKQTGEVFWLTEYAITRVRCDLNGTEIGNNG